MKKYLMLVMVAVFSMAITVQAQANKPEGQRERKEVSSKDRAERLAKTLELTEAQKAEVITLFEKQDKDRIKMRENVKDKAEKNEKAREEMKAKFNEQRKSEREALEKVIGKEKMEKLDQMNKERMEKRDGQRDGQQRRK